MRLPVLTAIIAGTVGFLPMPGATTTIPTAGSGIPPRGLRLEGTFIQYQPWMMELSTEKWQKELNALRRAGLNTLVIQFHANGLHRFLADAPSSDETTAVILEYADRHGMEVFLGLATDRDWWQRWSDPVYLEECAATNVALVDTLWDRFGHHGSLAGWYIPTETWDVAYTADQIAQLRRCFRTISDHCRLRTGPKRLPVAIAPFFVGHTPPEQVEAIYTDLLTGAGIDIVMLQDGIGARGWDDGMNQIVPYFRAFRDACLAAGVELWSDLECFRKVPGPDGRTEGPPFEPASAARIARQLATAAPFVRKFVTFDAFNYMSPYRNEAARRLHADYVAQFVDKPFFPVIGRAVQVDPSFGYYRDRSPASIAAEIRAAGYSIVHYVVSADSQIDSALIDAFHDEKIGVWYATFGNGVYTTKDLPAGWQNWRMVTRHELEGKALDDGFTRLCMNQAPYRAWFKQRLERVLKSYSFDGVAIFESHWPAYPGPESPAYSCFCNTCLDAFRAMFPEEHRLPDILDPDSPYSARNNPALWKKWLTFRQRSQVAFLDDLFNGPGGLRYTARPNVLLSVWSLALADGGPDRVREIHGEDPAEIARTVRPDVFGLQTHWPDWIRGELPPDYVNAYEPFIVRVCQAMPDLPLLVQADIGSRKTCRRGGEWIEAFERACEQIGVTSSTLYEYFIGLDIYTEPPRLTEVRRDGPRLELRFTKRLDPVTAGQPDRYRLRALADETAGEPADAVKGTSGSKRAAVANVQVDGSRVFLEVSNVADGRMMELTVRGLRDDPARRLFRGHEATVLVEQNVRFR